MRTIKFRGFDAVGEKGWVYGDLVHNQRVTTTGLQPRIMVGGYEVIEDTVGEFTALNDNRGNEIHEGDILHVPGNDFYAEFDGVVVFSCGAFRVRSLNFGTESDLAWCVRERMVGDPRAEIIGNTHDNPELLNTKLNENK